jgi:hypothetical protein
VTPVHPWGYDDSLDDILHPERNVQVTVMKLGSTVQEQIEDYQTCQGRAPDKDHETFYSGRNNQFTDVKTSGRGDVNFHVAVMGPVEPP